FLRTGLSVSPCLFTVNSPSSVFDTLSLHDALPIYNNESVLPNVSISDDYLLGLYHLAKFHDVDTYNDLFNKDVSMSTQYHDLSLDRKSTRLNSSHVSISYAVFCLKKKSITYDHK